ncbi:MAG: hypothetical protein LBR07_05220 [Puniceicoccales bacterium]|jgi:hypothetical protein|nr:hypothetical protein [Puniceicoccales bacterium]
MSAPSLTQSDEYQRELARQRTFREMWQNGVPAGSRVGIPLPDGTTEITDLPSPPPEFATDHQPMDTGHLERSGSPDPRDLFGLTGGGTLRDPVADHRARYADLTDDQYRARMESQDATIAHSIANRAATGVTGALIGIGRKVLPVLATPLDAVAPGTSDAIRLRYDDARRELDDLKTAHAPYSQLSPFWGDTVEGVADSMTKMLALRAAGGGMKTMATGFGIDAATDAYERGRQDGLDHNRALLYGAAHGAAEAGVMSIFDRLGLGGAERAVIDAFGASAAAGVRTVKDVLKAAAKQTILGEVPEELVTSAVQKIADDIALNDSSTWEETIKSTLAQTLLTMGIVNAKPTGAAALNDLIRKVEGGRMKDETASGATGGGTAAAGTAAAGTTAAAPAGTASAVPPMHGRSPASPTAGYDILRPNAAAATPATPAAPAAPAPNPVPAPAFTPAQTPAPPPPPTTTTPTTASDRAAQQPAPPAPPRAANPITVTWDQSKLSDEEKTAQNQFISELNARTDEENDALYDAAAKDGNHTGVYINADTARSLFSGWKDSDANRRKWKDDVTYQVAAAYVANRFRRELERTKGRGSVTFLAGGAGSGKGSANVKGTDADIVFDSNFAGSQNPDGTLNFEKQEALIAAARAAGKRVSIIYVHVPIEQAAAQAHSRFEKTGRDVEPEHQGGLHYRAQQTFLHFLNSYLNGNQNHISSIKIYDNGHPLGEGVWIGQEEAKNVPESAENNFLAHAALDFMSERGNILYRDEHDPKTRARNTRSDLAGTGATGAVSRSQRPSPSPDERGNPPVGGTPTSDAGEVSAGEVATNQSPDSRANSVDGSALSDPGISGGESGTTSSTAENSANEQDTTAAPAESAVPPVHGRGVSARPGGTPSSDAPVDSPKFTPAPAGKVPWLDQRSETQSGRQLRQRIAADTKGAKYGAPSVFTYLREQLGGLLTLKSRSQTSRKHPANYHPDSDTIFTRSGAANEVNTHEVGHAIHARLTELGWTFPPNVNIHDFTRLASNRMSYASADNASEAVAEWVRRYINDPVSVAGHPLTKSIENFLVTHDSRGIQIINTLRDAARAQNETYRRPLLAQFHALNADQSTPQKSWHETLAAVPGQMHSLITALISRGHAWRALEARAFRAIRRAAANDDLGLAAARAWRADAGNSLGNAYQETLLAKGQVTTGFLGKGGLTVFDDKGQKVVVHPKSYAEIISAIPGEQWQDFEAYGWARTMLARYRAKALDYPGRNSGWGPQRLARMVKEAEAANPTWGETYKQVESLMDSLLKLDVRTGLVTGEEYQRIREAYEDYWPLPRLIRRDMGQTGTSVGGAAGLESKSGVHRAYGSEEAVLSLHEAVERRMWASVKAYAHEKFKRTLVKTVADLAKRDGLDRETRASFAQLFTPLKPEKSTVAKISASMQADIIAKAAKDLGLTVTDEKTGQRRAVTAEDITVLGLDGIPITKTDKPTDFTVMSVANGTPTPDFYLITDPALLSLIANNPMPKDGAAERAIAFAKSIFSPYIREMKQLATQNAAFIIKNVVADAFNTMLTGRGKRSFLPFANHVRGIIGRMRGETTGIATDTEMLSHELSGETDLAAAINRSAWEEIWKSNWFRLEGKPKLQQAAAIIGNILMFPFKVSHTALVFTGQRAAATFTEALAREGAALNERDRGGSAASSAKQYALSSGDFGERPGNATWSEFTTLLPFFNPMLQAGRQEWGKLTDPDPAVRRATALKIAVGGLALPTLAWALARLVFPDDDEEKRKAAERDPAEKARWAQVGPVRFPFPRGAMGAAAATVWNTLDEVVLGMKTRQKTRFAKAVLAEAVTISGTWSDLIPWGVKQAVEVASNHSFWSDKPIVPLYLERLSEPDLQVRADTPRLYRSIASLFHASPLVVEHMFRQTYGRQLSYAIEVADKFLAGENIAKTAGAGRAMPLIGSFVATDPKTWSSASVQDLQEIEKRYDALNARLRSVGFEAGVRGLLTWDPDSAPWRLGEREVADITALQNVVGQAYRMHVMSNAVEKLATEASKLKRAGFRLAAEDAEKRMTTLAIRVAADHYDASSRALDEAMRLEAATRATFSELSEFSRNSNATREEQERQREKRMKDEG